MADSDREIRPRELQAMEIWESLPESERNYAEVARQLGVTEGRAGVYVRDALTISGKEHLLPQRGRRSGSSGNAAAVVEEDPNPIHDLERMLATVDERVTALNAQLAEVTKEADEFDPIAAANAEQERLQKIVDDAQSALDEFAGDDAKQTQWATRRQGQLNQRKTEVEQTVAKRVERLGKKRDGLAQIVELASNNPDLAAMFASTVDEDEADDPEALTNEPADDVEPEPASADES